MIFIFTNFEGLFLKMGFMQDCSYYLECLHLLTCVRRKDRMERMYQSRWSPWWQCIPCHLDVSQACCSEHCVAEQCSSMPADTSESLWQSYERQLANKLSMDLACRSPFSSGLGSVEMPDLRRKHMIPCFSSLILILSYNLCLHLSTPLDFPPIFCINFWIPPQSSIHLILH